MKTIRRGCFETNSSSMHSLTVMTESNFNAWKEGKIYMNLETGERSTEEESETNENVYSYDDFLQRDCEFGFYNDTCGDQVCEPKEFAIPGVDEKIVSFVYTIPC